MTSLKWKYRGVKPDEPPPPLTGWPKAKNWLHYNRMRLAADMTSGDSVFFVTDDPQSLQTAYQILAVPDGTAPAEDALWAALIEGALS